jgi:RNA polymerase primary sigma factor
MMYLNERLSQRDAVSVLSDDDTLTPQDEIAVSAISHVASVVETDNFEIARHLKAGKSRLINVLCHFPVTALWLLKQYEQCCDCDKQDTENSTVSESKAAMCAIRNHYTIAQAAANTADSQLFTALQSFPFSFEELTQLTDLLVYAFKVRGLHYCLDNSDIVNKRLEGTNKKHTGKLAVQFKELVCDYGDESFLFLSNTDMMGHFAELVLAEQLWINSRKTLVSANSRLVLFIANQYKSNFLDFDDLVQEGQTGLLKAVDRFNPDLGFQFSTYSSYWIRKAISRALSRCERVVRVPCGQMATINRVYRAKDELMLKTGKEPSITELAAYTKMTEQEINTILSISQTAMSLENFDDDDDTSAPIDFLEQQIFTHAFVEIAESDLGNVLNKAMQTLNPREAKVIACHFGVENDIEMTLQEIGAELHLTRERVRQIQVMALNKMKRHYGEQLVSFL